MAQLFIATALGTRLGDPVLFPGGKTGGPGESLGPWDGWSLGDQVFLMEKEQNVSLGEVNFRSIYDEKEASALFCGKRGQDNIKNARNRRWCWYNCLDWKIKLNEFDPTWNARKWHAEICFSQVCVCVSVSFAS